MATEASLWLAVCGTRCWAGYSSLSADPWCKRLLYEVAGPEGTATYTPDPVGRDGFLYTFRDGSKLLVNSAMATVL